MLSVEKDVAVPGFLANGISVGIKEDGGKDLALIYSSSPATSVGMFTTNSFKAPSIQIGMDRIKSGRTQAIITNSGNANAATGTKGYDNALAISREVSKTLHIDDELVLMASTGIIGQNLPMEKIIGNVNRLVEGLRPAGIVDAEEAIMTTDKYPKISYCKATIGKKTITLCGMAKGAGMISPHMATMLAFFMTDANIEKTALQKVFRQAVGESFNSITVDGCMSTNDMAVILANGAAGNGSIQHATKDFYLFKAMLSASMSELAETIVRDGEGATKVIEVSVQEASSLAYAKKIAYAVANSNLVKTAFFGCDPNWGRIISAIGSVGIPLTTSLVKLYLNEIPIFADDLGIKGYEKQLSEVMKQPYIKLKICLGGGKKSFHLLASDLGYDYIKINAHYHT